MKIAFRTHDLGAKGLEGVISALKSHSISAVQLVVYKFMEGVKQLPGSLTPELAEEIGSALREAGVSVPLVGAYFNPVHSNKQKVADCTAAFKDYIRLAKVLGADIVGSETGSFNDDKWTYNPLNRTDDALKTVVETFGGLADYAARYGVKIGMEGAAGHCCWCVKQLKRATDAIARPNVKVIFDLYNYLDMSNYGSYMDILEEGLATFAGNIAVFHMKDFVVEGEKLRQVPPGQGMFDYKGILSRIKAYDPEAVLVLEGTTGEAIDPAVAFINSTWNNIR